MRKGFTLIECVLSTAIITILLIALFPAAAMGLKANRDTTFKDYEFNIARTVCEKFTDENVEIQDKSCIIYVNNIDEIPDNITSLVNSQINECKTNSIDYSQSRQKQFSVLIEGTLRSGLSFIRVTVQDIRYRSKGVTLYTAR